MDSLLDFTGKVATITGVASGFGKLLAEDLGSRGCSLVIGDINLEGLKATEQSLIDKGVSVKALQTDVSQEQDIKNMTNTAMAQFGRIDMAINNAGVAHTPMPSHELDEQIFDTQMNVNVKSIMFGMKYQIPAMLSQGGGHILNVSSLAGLGAAPKGGAYSAAKHAVIGLSKTAAVEYAKHGVRVNTICPFYSPTAILDVDGYNTEESRAFLAKGCPMKRLADPQEVVNTMVLMLSPGNSYMTGQSIAVDGGVTAF
ncbi:glucose 1-dehydrogenase [Alteromonadaceae bacterium M269]|nr:glucose 1-dehydrogenase [Alteromonadaceae bacterium M269]